MAMESSQEILVEYAQPGMILASNVANRAGDVLIRRQTMVDRWWINCFREQGIDRINILNPLKSIEMFPQEVLRSTKDRTRYLLKIGLQTCLQSNLKTGTVIDELSIIDDILSDNSYLGILTALCIYDEYTYVHSVNTTVYSITLGVDLGFERKELRKIAIGSLFHDIGKVFIEKNIISKPGKLDPSEFAMIKNHSNEGVKFITNCCDIPLESCLMIGEHHEKPDGSGYPKGIMQINIYSKIASIVDVFDALTSDRPYRTGLPIATAKEIMIKDSGKHFDMDLLNRFLRKIQNNIDELKKQA